MEQEVDIEFVVIVRRRSGEGVWRRRKRRCRCTMPHKKT